MIWYRDKYSMLLLNGAELACYEKNNENNWYLTTQKVIVLYASVCEMMVCGTRMLEIHHFYFFNKSVVDMF